MEPVEAIEGSVEVGAEAVEGPDRREEAEADRREEAMGADRREEAEASLSHVRHPHLPRIASASGCSAEVDPAAAEEVDPAAAAAEVAAEVEVDPAAAKAGVDPTT